jgi:hypothetical protein
VTSKNRDQDGVKAARGARTAGLQGGGGEPDPRDRQALISNMVIGSRSPAGRWNSALCNPSQRGSPGGVICSYLGQSL